MSFNRAEAIDRQFIEFLKQGDARPARRVTLDEPVREGTRLTGGQLLDLLDSQMRCRHLDLIARVLRGRDAGFYTIASAGHEGNAVMGMVVRKTDPTFLHYRSGALMLQRSKQDASIDPLLDTLLSQAAAADDPISGGRHKVWGSRPLWVPPQTSTIASHLPKAVGTAIGIDRAKKVAVDLPIPTDSIAMCTFGDASLNHAVAQTAFNAAGWCRYQKIPVPILFVCEDNGIGISVPTPPGWVEASMQDRPGIAYVTANGLDLPNLFDAATEAVEYCRTRRAAVFLHVKTIRMLGHAGSDVETEYHTLAEIEATEKHDPLLASARLAIEAGLLTAAELLERYETIRARVAELAEVVVVRSKLKTAAEVMTPLAPFHADQVHAEASRARASIRTTPSPFKGEGWGEGLSDRRLAPGSVAGLSTSPLAPGSPASSSTNPLAPGSAGGSPAIAPLPPLQGKKHMAALINRGLHETFEKYPETLAFGEDVAQRGGVYYVTAGLYKRFGPARVFNTLLDETTILGLAQGTAHLGFLPIPEIQYLAYVHNAEDQIRGEACSLQYFSNGQFRNPMVIRIQGFSYQKGFGGHFHNDNSIAVLRDIPGLIIAAPARGDDAVRMLRTCLALAKVDGRVVVIVEPIALYMTKDLHEKDDGLWQFEFPAPGDVADLGECRVYDETANDLTIITYANGTYMSLRAAKTLTDQHNIRARIVDLRWLNPINHDFVAEQARATSRALIVDECRRAGGIGEALLAALTERCGPAITTSLIAAEDTYVPLGPAMRTVMPGEDQIVAAALALSHKPPVAKSAARTTRAPQSVRAE